MHLTIELIGLAGIVQLALVGANVSLPHFLRPSTELAPVSPMIRKMFYVHWIYIVFVLLIFSGLSLRFAGELASGHPLGRFISAAIALFWLARVPIQLFYYDAELRRANRLGDVACITAFTFLGLVYGIAAAGVWL
jgi:hypothetical protein